MKTHVARVREAVRRLLRTRAGNPDAVELGRCAVALAAELDAGDSSYRVTSGLNLALTHLQSCGPQRGRLSPLLVSAVHGRLRSQEAR